MTDKSILGREEAAAESLEGRDPADIRGTPLTGIRYDRKFVRRLAQRVMMENAYRKGEWVTFQDRPISNLELIIRELMESSNHQAKVAVVELAFGKEPQVNEHEGGIEVVFRVEHSDDWIDGPTVEVVDSGPKRIRDTDADSSYEAEGDDSLASEEESDSSG